jgi:hypothetical protein
VLGARMKIEISNAKVKYIVCYTLLAIIIFGVAGVELAHLRPESIPLFLKIILGAVLLAMLGIYLKIMFLTSKFKTIQYEFGENGIKISSKSGDGWRIEKHISAESISGATYYRTKNEVLNKMLQNWVIVKIAGGPDLIFGNGQRKDMPKILKYVETELGREVKVLPVNEIRNKC